VSDPLLDLAQFKRDVKEFQKLGINTIRVYTVDNGAGANHDEGMKLLADAGIYLALDVNTPQNSLNRKDEAAIHMSYNDVRSSNCWSARLRFAGLLEERVCND
jgi:1,3-beta-glucanosyltransferase GAS5